MRAEIFHKEEDYAAFERILDEGLGIHQVEIYAYQLMPNHYHLVLRPLRDGEMSRFMGWVGGTHTMRYHSHYHTSGMGHVYQQRYKSFPIQDDDHFWVVFRYVERNALRAGLVSVAEVTVRIEVPFSTSNGLIRNNYLGSSSETFSTTISR